MRILFFHHNGDLYGAGRSLVRLAGRLARDGHSVHVVLRVDGPIRQLLEEKGVVVHMQPQMLILDRGLLCTWPDRWRWLFGLGRACGAARKLIRVVKPDIVHTNVSVIFYTGWIAWRMRIPHVLHLREWEERAGRYWKIYVQIIGAFVDHIVCVSSYVLSKLPNSLQAHASVVHNGIPVGDADAVSPVRVTAFREQHLLGQARLVGVFGRINLERKGQGTFIEAALQLAPHFQDVCFVVIGECVSGKEHYRQALKQRIQESGQGAQIRLLGNVEDIWAAYQAMDLVVMPSRFPEGLGNTTIEAMACGIPVIGTRLGGTCDIIVDGQTGYFFEPDDVHGLVIKVKQLLQDENERRRLGVAARQRFLAEFEFEKFYEHMMTVYKIATHDQTIVQGDKVAV